MRTRLDPFTQKRLLKFIEEFRARTGVLPTLQDLDQAGFDRNCIERALREQLLEQFYVTLTSGTVVKGFKIKTER